MFVKANLYAQTVIIHCDYSLSGNQPVWVSYPELGAGEGEEVDLPKVVTSGQQALLIGAAHSVDVSPIRTVRPQP